MIWEMFYHMLVVAVWASVLGSSLSGNKPKNFKPLAFLICSLFIAGHLAYVIHIANLANEKLIPADTPTMRTETIEKQNE